MKNILLSLFTLLPLAACTSIIAGTGTTTKGTPISGQFVMTPINGGVEFVVSFVPPSQSICQGTFRRSGTKLISKFPVSCDNGQTGTATLTSDFINFRDTLIYRLGNGEQGKIVFGATTAISG